MKKPLLCFLSALIFCNSAAYSATNKFDDFWRNHQSISPEINRVWIETQQDCSANSAQAIRLVKSRSSDLSSIADEGGKISETLRLMISTPGFPLVNSLSFRKSEISAEDFRKLTAMAPRMKGIKDLYFGGSKIENKRALFLFLLAVAPQIEILELSNLNLEADDISPLLNAIAGMKNLRVLYLDENEIGDIGLHKLMNQGFGGGSEIRILSLRSNNLTERSMKRFSQSFMTSLQKLQILDLRSNNFNKFALELLLKNAFSMPQLIALDVDPIDDSEGFVGLLKAPNLVQSAFLKCHIFSSEIFAE